jgi:hypothetical protein
MTKFGRGDGLTYYRRHDASGSLSRHARRYEPCWGLGGGPP